MTEPGSRITQPESAGRSATPEVAGRAWDALALAARDAAGVLEPEALRSLLCIEVEGTAYALAVESIREILRERAITPVPRVDPALRGVLSLRGEILQVVDLRTRLGLTPLEDPREGRVVVVESEPGRRAGLLVDRVHEVLRVDAETLLPAPAGEGGGFTQNLCARDSHFVGVLDVMRLMELGDDV